MRGVIKNHAAADGYIEAGGASFRNGGVWRPAMSLPGKSVKGPAIAMTRGTLVFAIGALLSVGCTPSAKLESEQASEVSTAGEDQTVSERASELYHSPEDLVLGNPSGEVTVVEFFDYNCGYCRRALPEVEKLLRSNNDARVVIKEFPVLGQGSVFAAKAALASAQQGKYAAFHHALNAAKTNLNEASVLQIAAEVGIDTGQLRKDMQSETVARVLSKNRAIAQSLSINGTPSFVIDGVVLQGYASYKTLAEHIAAPRAKSSFMQ